MAKSDISPEEAETRRAELEDHIAKERAEVFGPTPEENLDEIEASYTKLQRMLCFYRIVTTVLQDHTNYMFRKNLDGTDELALAQGRLFLLLSNALRVNGANEDEVNGFLYGEEFNAEDPTVRFAHAAMDMARKAQEIEEISSEVAAAHQRDMLLSSLLQDMATSSDEEETDKSSLN